MLRAERRRHGDVIAAASLAVAVVVAAVALWSTSPVSRTSAVPVTGTIPSAPPGPTDVPATMIEVWRAPSAATSAPVVAGPVVVTGDVSAADPASGSDHATTADPAGGGGTVAGRDALTGRPRWSYSRDLPLCTVGSGWGNAIAVFRNGGYCSEVTTVVPGTGRRGPQRNSDVHPGGRLLDDGYLVTASGPDYLEVWRSDLVKTMAYGATRTDAQPGRQPRPQCRHAGVAVTEGRVAVLERCPGEPTDRLTLLRPDGNEADSPEEQFSVALPAAGARLVAVNSDRVAVLLPGPPRLSIRDEDGAEVAVHPLDLPPADLAPESPGGVEPGAESLRVHLWWTGSRTVALDVSELAPRWSVPDTLGPGSLFAGRLVVPVPGGLAVLDADTGARLRTAAVDRGRWDGPVLLDSIGPVLLEQRGPTLVALR